MGMRRNKIPPLRSDTFIFGARIKVSLLSLIFLLLFSSCQEAKKEPLPFNLNWEAIADKLVERMQLTVEEKVLLVAQAGDFDPLVPLLREKIRAANAEDLGVVSVGDSFPQSWETEFTRQLKGKSRSEIMPILHAVDLAVMLPGPTPSDSVYGAMQGILREGLGRTIHFHWSGAYDLQNNAIAITEQIDQFYQRVLLETDYEKLAEDQRQFEEAMRGRIIRVTTPLGTDLSFEIGDRPVTRQDGNASALRAKNAVNLIDREVELPAGAVRVAPIEETVKGIIAFPTTTWSGQKVEGLKMAFEEGKLVSFETVKGGEAVEMEIEKAGESARSFREFVLGMNPLLAIPTEGQAWIPYYGYGAGVVRLSLGDNLELGGKVGGGYVRWNFFSDATVTIGEEVWVKDGKLRR